MPLLSGVTPWLLATLGAAGALFLLVRRPRRWWTRTVPGALLAGVLLGATVTVAVDRVWRPFADDLPAAVTLVIGLAGTTVVLAGAGLRSRRAPGRALSLLALGCVVLALGQAVNAVYGAYPTVGSAVGLPPPDDVLGLPSWTTVLATDPARPLAEQWRPPADLPTAGEVVEVPVPGTTSGFSARPGWVYLPPAYLVSPRPLLPVLVLLSGQPGDPRDWLDGGALAGRMDAFAAAHGGLAPVVVMADHLGSPLANPLCVDSPLGDAATYLELDVPAWIAQHLQVAADPAHRAVGGLSNGGTCSLQLAVTAPAAYPTFVDLSGEQEPSLGDRATTVAAAFGGDTAAFAAVNPLDVLARTRFPGTSAFLVAGRDDQVYRPAAERVDAACRAAGMDVRFTVLPGGHEWRVWGAGLDAALPWLGARWGLTP